MEVIHSQQLVVPVVLVCITIVWQAIIGDLSWSSVLSNAWRTLIPLLVTIGVFAIVMSILAAKDLNKELVSAHRTSHKPVVSSSGDVLAPQTIPRTPGIVFGTVFSLFIIGLEILVFRAAYPSIPLPPIPPYPKFPPKMDITQGKDADRRKVFRPSPTQEQARIEISNIEFGRSSEGYLMFNVYHANQGVLPSQGFLRKYALAASPVELSLNDTNKIQACNSVFDEADLVNLETDYRESYRNSPNKEFFSVPGHPGEEANTIAKNADDVLAGKTYLYLFVTLAYRDARMSKDVYGATETCVYFIRTFAAWHSCGNRFVLRQIKDSRYSRASPRKAQK